MIQTVLKRDGRVVGFNEEKIKAAIRKAMLVTEEGEDESVKVEKDSAIEVFKDMIGVEER